MVQISLGLDAEVDILSSHEYLSDQRQFRSRLKRIMKGGDNSLHKTLVASGQFVADPFLLDFGDPPAGAMWVPLWITVCGATDSQVVANATCAVYFGGDSGNLSLANLLIPATAANTPIPFNAQLGGKDAIYGHYGDHFAVQVHGAVTVGQNITGILRVREIHPAASEELNTL